MKRQTQQMMDLLLDRGLSHEDILNWIINNYLSGEQAINALQLMEMELFDDAHSDGFDDVFYDHEDDVELDDVDEDDHPTLGLA